MCWSGDGRDIKAENYNDPTPSGGPAPTVEFDVDAADLALFSGELPEEESLLPSHAWHYSTTPTPICRPPPGGDQLREAKTEGWESGRALPTQKEEGGWQLRVHQPETEELCAHQQAWHGGWWRSQMGPGTLQEKGQVIGGEGGSRF